jgi:hypothetical protein
MNVVKNVDTRSISASTLHKMFWVKMSKNLMDRLNQITFLLRMLRLTKKKKKTIAQSNIFS